MNNSIHHSDTQLQIMTWLHHVSMHMVCVNACNVIISQIDKSALEAGL